MLHLVIQTLQVLVPPYNNRYISWGFGDLSMRTGVYETERVTCFGVRELYLSVV